jgi:hypothetical protein
MLNQHIDAVIGCAIRTDVARTHTCGLGLILSHLLLVGRRRLLSQRAGPCGWYRQEVIEAVLTGSVDAAKKADEVNWHGFGIRDAPHGPDGVRMMARTARSTPTPKAAAKGRKPGRPTSATAKVKSAKTTRGTVASKRAATAPTAAPKLSKDELRAQLEKLERANATLRSKSREANRAAKTAAARIAELEQEVARLEKRIAAPAAKTGRGQRASSPQGRRGQHRNIDPGDAVPSGGAAEEPAPLDREAESARENLEDHLGSGHSEPAPLDAEEF